MTIIEIITKKKDKKELTYEEIDYVIKSYLESKVTDYQMSALLMAITINGMTEQETFALTKIMLESGEQIDLHDLGNVVDKHSTGGIGDKTTLVLAPLVASCNVNVAKMSGRGLGFTGGTIDKLESIKNFDVAMDIEKFKEQVKKIHVAIVGQMGNLVPADKKIYALRDVTGTVESIPLIASSIMSKKLASGAKSIVIDVKVGSGALMKNMEDAQKLASLLVKIGNQYNRKTVCFITNMDEPLGLAIGNSLEVIESIETLKGKGPKDLEELVIKLATYMVSMGKGITTEEAKKEVEENLSNNKAYEKFEELVKEQNGEINNIEVSNRIFSVRSISEGYINKINAMRLGEIVRDIGAGRQNKEDEINYKVGVVLNKKVGDYVKKDEELIKVYLDKVDVKIRDILECFTIEQELKEKEILIKEIIE